MGIIADLLVHDSEFPLARKLGEPFADGVSVNAMVAVDDAVVVLFAPNGPRGSRTPHEERDTNPDFSRLVDTDSTELYVVRWAVPEEGLLPTLLRFSNDVIRANGQHGIWRVQATFDSPDALDRFLARCREADVPVRLDRCFGASDASTPWFGVTPPQRDALLLACEEGYYDIPRGASTADLADRLDISDQAVTERLRRGIRTLVEHTLASAASEVSTTASFTG